MRNSLNHKLLDLFKILAENSHLNFFQEDSVIIKTSNEDILLKIDSNSLETAVDQPFNPTLFHRNSIPNSFVDLSDISRLIKVLSTRNKIVRLNHVGFCYKVHSKTDERKRIVKAVAKTNLHVYEEESPDDSDWLFIGNTNHWEDPLLELVLVEKASDQWVDYWLPHFQIDIDTTLSEGEIKKHIYKIFGDKIKPIRLFVIEGDVIIIRSRLGVINGLNINLDFATKYRDVQYHREKILKKIVI